MKILLLLCFFSFFALGQSNQFVVKTQATGSATITSTSVLAANLSRCYLLIVNNGSVSINAKLGSAHTALEGVTIPAGGNWEPSRVPVSAIFLQSASGSQSYAITEGDCR